MRARPGRLVLLGHPVVHSLSPQFQNAALRAAGIALVYEAVDVDAAGLDEVLGELRSIGAAGNVTIPHKEAVAARCGALTPVARRAGAVNTFWCEGGALIGDNTDVGGFEAAVAEVTDPRDGHRPRTVAVFGAGGAAAAVLAAVAQWPGAEARVSSRSPSRARGLCSRFPSVARPFDAPADAVADADLVVNATPIGLADDSMPVDPGLLEPRAAVIDLVYRRGGTPWVRAASTRGHRAVDGTVVLLEQGALAFERWFGFPPDRAVMRAALSGSG